MAWGASIFKQCFPLRSRVSRCSTRALRDEALLPVASRTRAVRELIPLLSQDVARSFSRGITLRELPHCTCTRHMQIATLLRTQNRKWIQHLSPRANHYSSSPNNPSPSKKPPNHKVLLHRIIKAVHPDYFSSHPNEQMTNTTSLQYLNEWLNEFEKFDLNGGARSTIQRVGRKFHISFFYRPVVAPEDAKSNSNSSIPQGSSLSGAHGSDVLGKSEILNITETLYGPMGTLGVREKYRILCSGLVRLMTLMQLDIPEEFKRFVVRSTGFQDTRAEMRESYRERERTTSSQDANGKDETVYDAFNDNIFDFLYSIPLSDLQAAIIAKDQQLMARVDVDLFRNRIGEFLGSTGGVLMRAYGTRSKDQLKLIHSFLKTLESNFPGLDTRYWNRKLVRQTTVYDANEEAATTFTGSLRHDALQRKLHGVSLFIDEGNCRVDNDGSVVLGADDSTDYWLEFLEHHFDPEEAIIRGQFRSMVHDLERRAALLLNVSLVIPESEELGSTTKYARFLESVIDFSPFEEHAKNPTPITQFLCENQHRDFYDGVYVVIREPQNAISYDRDSFHGGSKKDSNHDPDDESTISVHPRFGFIQLDIGEPPQDVHYFVETMGSYARYLSEKNQSEVKLRNYHLNHVRRRFQLHTVQAANNLTTEQVIECCNRLEECGSELVQWLKGKNLIISDGFKFHQNALEIQWDFQM